eukprot:3874609-Lingulodinium_polyedra.AAC.1
MVAHAPVSSAPLEEKEAFWEALEREAGQALHQRRLLVFIDANDDDEGKGHVANALFAQEFKEAFGLLDAAESRQERQPT